MTIKQKKERINGVVHALKKIYPVALCSLEYEGEGWKLLVMGRLSAQCTDERVNIVCRELFSVYPTMESLADAPLEDIERIVKPCGLYKMKASSIKASMNRLMREYNGVIPNNMDELLKFEGVGRKIANLLLGDLYGMPAIVADTHCMRICGRLGMYPEGQKDPIKTERIMSRLIEPSEQSDFCHRMVLFGREYCTAKNPKCNICPIYGLCKGEKG
ncbi:MAG: endonuclease III [Clostridia bacterium]|nr:endonuclease III [Clostridia bacterium]